MSSESKASATDDAGDAGVTRIACPAKECDVTGVTVFSDRAEVTRAVTATTEKAGLHEIVVEGLTKNINTESVRVKGTGTGAYSILEVSFGVHTKVEESKGAAGSVADLKSKVEALVKQSKALSQDMEIVRREKTLLDGYAASVLSGKPHGSGSDTVSPGPVRDLKFVEDLLSLRTSRISAADAKLNKLGEEHDAVQLELATARSNLNELTGSRRGRTTTKSNDVTVAVNVEEPGEVHLSLSYQVSQASWSPSYDVRISSSDSEMELTYHGLVQQSTGEDWTNAKVVLSTATPSVGGSAPILPTKTVTFAYSAPTVQRKKARRSISRRAEAAPMMNMQAEMFEMGEAMAPSAAAAPPPAAAVATSKVEGGGGQAATFVIDRPATIESDNKPHKVTVAILKLHSSFRYYTVPALSPEAYLQAQTTNSSEYPFLASKKVSVFLDGSFVSTTEIRNVSPGESFRNFLGVDRSIRVTYKPQAAVRSSKGMFTKSANVSYAFLTTIKNTKDSPARVVMADILPKSTDERIKVHIVSPAADELEGDSKVEDDGGEVEAAAAAGRRSTNSVAQNKVTNNIVWNRTIPAGETLKVRFEYAIEHPPESAVYIN